MQTCCGSSWTLRVKSARMPDARYPMDNCPSVQVLKDNVEATTAGQTALGDKNIIRSSSAGCIGMEGTWQ